MKGKNQANNEEAKQQLAKLNSAIKQRSFNLIEYRSLDVTLIPTSSAPVKFTFLDDEIDGQPEGAFYVMNEGKSPSQWLSCAVPIKLKKDAKEANLEINIAEDASFNVEFTYSGQPIFIVEIEDGAIVRCRTFNLKGDEMAILQLSSQSLTDSPNEESNRAGRSFFDDEDDAASSIALILDGDKHQRVEHLAEILLHLCEILESGDIETAREDCRTAFVHLFNHSDTRAQALRLYELRYKIPEALQPAEFLKKAIAEITGEGGDNA